MKRRLRTIANFWLCCRNWRPINDEPYTCLAAPFASALGAMGKKTLRIFCYNAQSRRFVCDRENKILLAFRCFDSEPCLEFRCAATRQNNVYATDTRDGRIQIFRLSDGSFVTSIAEGHIPTYGTCPITVSDDRIFVLAQKGCRAFDRQGRLVFMCETPTYHLYDRLSFVVVEQELMIRSGVQHGALQESGRA
jgi:hypothetical protein